jgi:hypothetical protein
MHEHTITRDKLVKNRIALHCRGLHLRSLVRHAFVKMVRPRTNVLNRVRVERCTCGATEEHLSRAERVATFRHILQIKRGTEEIVVVGTHHAQAFQYLHCTLGRSVGLRIFCTTEVKLHADRRRKQLELA